MKQLIVPVAIIVALIAFFVIIDRKEFNRHDDVQTVQSESSMTNRKPTVSVPETKPITEVKPTVETKPVAETKPVTDSTPVTEANPKKDAKPAETKPVAETKPAETVAEAKLEDNPAPAAVPVVTAEEAEKLNDFVIFLSTVKTTVVEGEITERSELPDPQKSDYPNCRFTAHFNGNSIKSGEECPKEFVLIVEGFLGYSVLSENDIKQGDKIECSIIPFERLPTEYQETQQSDDLNLYLLERYYATSIQVIKSFNDNADFPNSGIFFSDSDEEYISIFDRHVNPPISKEINENQNNEIQKTLKRMQSLLEDYSESRISEINKDFHEAWEIEKEKDASGFNRVVFNGQKLVWRNIDNTFWSLPEDYSFLSQPVNLKPDTLACFSALNNACKSNGVHFMVSFVPNRDVISARVINSQFNDIPDLQTATYVKQLSEIGVECVYCSDIIVHEYKRFPHAYMYPTDPHPADTAQDVITDILTNKLYRYSLDQEFEPDSEVFVKAYKECVVWPDNCDIGNNQVGEAYEYRSVSCKFSKDVPKDSEIMLIGNSFANLPLNATHSLLQYKLRSRVESYKLASLGPFSEIIFQLISRPDYFLKNKRVLIMQVGTDHLTAANNLNIMLNIEHVDEDRLLLNGKRRVTQLFSREMETDNEYVERWGNLSVDKRNIFKIGPNRHVEIISLDLEKEGSLDLSKDMVLVVPSTCRANTSATLFVNNISKQIHCSNETDTAKFFNLSFKLPAGTKRVDIKAEGKPNISLAIKNIQIWQ